jgi:hypothetical protein
MASFFDTSQNYGDRVGLEAWRKCAWYLLLANEHTDVPLDDCTCWCGD